MVEKTVAFLKNPIEEGGLVLPAAEKLVVTSLIGAGLEHRGTDIILSEKDLAEIYANLSGTPVLNDIFSLTLEQLANKRLRAFLIRGDDAVSKVFKLKGVKTHPFNCEPGSWRRELANQFGVWSKQIPRRPDEAFGGIFVSNYAHAPAQNEVARNLNVLENRFD